MSGAGTTFSGTCYLPDGQPVFFNGTNSQAVADWVSRDGVFAYDTLPSGEYSYGGSSVIGKEPVAFIGDDKWNITGGLSIALDNATTVSGDIYFSPDVAASAASSAKASATSSANAYTTSSTKASATAVTTAY